VVVNVVVKIEVILNNRSIIPGAFVDSRVSERIDDIKLGKTLPESVITNNGVSWSTVNIIEAVLSNGQEHATPTCAAKATRIPWKEVNGWDFWRYRTSESGPWNKIGGLR
jgi:hypothetical protein